MDWKEFLKPNKRKILVTIIFLILMSLPFLCSVTSTISSLITDLSSWDLICISYRELFLGSKLESSILGEIGIIIYFFLFILNIVPIVLSTINKILGIFVWIIYWYFLSCIVVWIYDKVKKKQHSE